VVAEGGSQGRDFPLKHAAPPPLGSKSREQEGDVGPLGGSTELHSAPPVSFRRMGTI